MRRALFAFVAIFGLVVAVPSSSDAATPSVAKVLTPVAGPSWNFNGTKCNLISTRTSTPVGVPLSCGGVRPGAYVTTVIGGCTFNFLYKAVGFPETYAGTAGHCIVPANRPGEYTSFANPRAYATVAGRSTHIGDFVYGRLDDQYDFSLIRLNAAGESVASPQMCHFGGPTGLHTGGVAFGETLQHYGNGLLVSSALPGRTHVGLFSDNFSITTASFAAVGDSGSGITDSAGRATGILVAVVSPQYGSAVVISSRLDTHLARAGAVLGKNLWVLTGPLA